MLNLLCTNVAQNCSSRSLEWIMMVLELFIVLRFGLFELFQRLHGMNFYQHVTRRNWNLCKDLPPGSCTQTYHNEDRLMVLRMPTVLDFLDYQSRRTFRNIVSNPSHPPFKRIIFTTNLRPSVKVQKHNIVLRDQRIQPKEEKFSRNSSSLQSSVAFPIYSLPR